MNNIYDNFELKLPLNWLDNYILELLMDYHLGIKDSPQRTKDEQQAATLAYELLVEEHKQRVENGSGKFKSTNLPQQTYEGWKVNEMKTELSKRLRDIEI